ncbi:MAG: hypothetical protein KC996_10405 [Phycisphaerales bacterium]|nr:hypothetical protein [Phycisphaerales bacterium]
MKNLAPLLCALLILSVLLGAGMLLEPASRTPNNSARGANASVLINQNEIYAQSGGGAADLYLNPNGGNVKTGPYGIQGPLAYGRVNSDGSPLSFSSNITATHRHGVGQYDIHVAGGAILSDVLIVTGYNIPAVVDVYIQDGAYHINTYWFTTEDRIDLGFSFVVFRP